MQSQNCVVESASYPCHDTGERNGRQARNIQLREVEEQEMRSKRTLLMIVLSLLLAVALAACSSSGDGSSDGSGGNAGSGGTSNTGGSSSSSNEDGNADEPITLYYYHEQAYNPSSNDVKERVHQEILKRSGYDLQVIPRPSSNPNDRLNIMLSSREPLDIFMANWHDYHSNGAIQPLTEYIEKYGNNIVEKWWAEESWSGLTDKDGNIWGLPRTTPRNGHPIFIRQDWLDQFELKFPDTLEELEHVLQVFKENDPAGNGQTIPVIGELDRLNHVFSPGFTGIGYGHFVDSDGFVKPVELHPGFRDYIAKMAEWYELGYFDRENFGFDMSQVRQFNGQGRVGVSASWYSAVTINAAADLAENIPGAHFTYHPEGIRGPAGRFETINGVNSDGYLVPAYSDKAEHVVKFLDWVYADPENFFLVFYGIEGEHWEWVDKENGVITMLVEPESPHGYNRDFAIGFGLPNETLVQIEGDRNQMHLEALQPGGVHVNFDRGERELSWDFSFNNSLVQERVPNLGDILRMMEEETTKFIMGARPLSEYDQYIEQLYSIGMDQLIEAYTEQYNELAK